MSFRLVIVPENAASAPVDAGSPPILQWIAISDLVIDDDYQRELARTNWSAIHAIAHAFRWSMFSPVFVAPVEGGKYAIIDGQHRTHAAAICGFEQVPCQIVLMTSREQAASFAAINGKVTRITSWQVYRAALAAGEAWAVDADGAARDGGARLMRSNAGAGAKKAGEIYSVMGMRRLVDRHGRKSVAAAIRFLLGFEKWSSQPQCWASEIILPMIDGLAERHFALSSRQVIEHFAEFNVWKAFESIERMVKAQRDSGQPVTSRAALLKSHIVRFMRCLEGLQPGQVIPQSAFEVRH